MLFVVVGNAAETSFEPAEKSLPVPHWFTKLAVSDMSHFFVPTIIWWADKQNQVTNVLSRVKDVFMATVIFIIGHDPPLRRLSINKRKQYARCDL